MASVTAVEAGFLASEAGQILVTRFLPSRDTRGVVLIVPPFAEEMNKSRKVLAEQGRQLALHGYQAVLPDLYGTGDSYGDFSAASWDIWKKDLLAALESARSPGGLPVYLLGLRLGAMLALDTFGDRAGDIRGFVLWSPCVDGKQFVNQFLRLRTATQMFGQSEQAESLNDLRELLAGDHLLEVGGYELSEALVTAIDALRLADLEYASGTMIEWLEVSSNAGGKIPPRLSRTVSQLAERGCEVNLRTVEGPPFWGTAELASCPSLIDATTSFFAEAQSA